LEFIKYTARKKMSNWTISKEISCESTNNLVKELKAVGKLYDKTAIMTEFQSSGRGQGKNSWHSEAGENLLVSIYIELNLPAEKYFLITIVISFAIAEILKDERIGCKIKWPNDIYVNDKKLAGILIENSLSSGIITNSIIGIGFNINQTKFPEWLPNPISLAQITGKYYNVDDIFNKLLIKLEAELNILQMGEESALFNRFAQLLYKKGEWSNFLIDGNSMRGRIEGIFPDGRLILTMENGETKNFIFGEISYLF
jgi:BirA family transcriptional regulator, biotin operon repressor / biotin---[acetyl-CoA-carboxylase] ligase